MKKQIEYYHLGKYEVKKMHKCSNCFKDMKGYDKVVWAYESERNSNKYYNNPNEWKVGTKYCYDCANKLVDELNENEKQNISIPKQLSIFG